MNNEVAYKPIFSNPENFIFKGIRLAFSFQFSRFKINIKFEWRADILNLSCFKVNRECRVYPVKLNLFQNILAIFHYVFCI